MPPGALHPPKWGGDSGRYVADMKCVAIIVHLCEKKNKLAAVHKETERKLDSDEVSTTFTLSSRKINRFIKLENQY